MSSLGGSCTFKIDRDRVVIAARFVLIVGSVTHLVSASSDAAPGESWKSQLAVFPPAIFGPSTTRPEPLRFSDTAIEPIEWTALKGWSADDHAAALDTFLASCRPLVRTSPREPDKRPMYAALLDVCRRALAIGRLTQDQARLFFERNFRPVRITKLGDAAGLLTGY